MQLFGGFCVLKNKENLKETVTHFSPDAVIVVVANEKRGSLLLCAFSTQKSLYRNDGMKKRNRKNQAAAAVFALGTLLFFLFRWLANKYDKVSLDQILYQLKTAASGTGSGMVSSVFVEVGLFGALGIAAGLGAWHFLSGGIRRFERYGGYRRYRETGLCAFVSARALSMASAVLALSLAAGCVWLHVASYVGAQSAESDFIEEHYIDPETVSLTFPEKKRNLIYIYLESMENTFADPAAGGLITEDFIPELRELAQENVNFSHTDSLGGAYSYTGTTWTAAAMVAQTSGLVVKVPLTADNYGGEDAYLPGVVSLGEVLEKAGYRQVLLLGSDAGFAGRDSYFQEHGNYEILDVNALKAQGRLDEAYYEWWGYEDEKLFQFAKEELTKLSQSGEPFHLTMLTADTHVPDGYHCRLCQEEYEEPYPNVLRCSARQVADFVAWIKTQPFFENTTVIISGDHLTMDPTLLETVEEDYVRTVYNCIINAPIEPVREKRREFATFDMLPTTLAALGIGVENERMGLGTNLFSNVPTLTEEYGFDALEEELQKNSLFYNAQFLQMTGETEEWLAEQGCGVDESKS